MDIIKKVIEEVRSKPWIWAVVILVIVIGGFFG